MHHRRAEDPRGLAPGHDLICLQRFAAALEPPRQEAFQVASQIGGDARIQQPQHVLGIGEDDGKLAVVRTSQQVQRQPPFLRAGQPGEQRHDEFPLVIGGEVGGWVARQVGERVALPLGLGPGLPYPPGRARPLQRRQLLQRPGQLTIPSPGQRRPHQLDLLLGQLLRHR